MRGSNDTRLCRDMIDGSCSGLHDTEHRCHTGCRSSLARLPIKRGASGAHVLYGVLKAGTAGDRRAQTEFEERRARQRRQPWPSCIAGCAEKRRLQLLPKNSLALGEIREP
ncbi:hypothetical protein MRX96_016471 [Rhipicephalus microplus]